MDLESEIRDLKRRVGDLEGAVGVLSGHLHNVYPELNQLKELSARSFSNLDTLMSRFVQRLDMVNTQVWSLRDDLPSLLSDALKAKRE